MTLTQALAFAAIAVIAVFGGLNILLGSHAAIFGTVLTLIILTVKFIRGRKTSIQ